jgi:hypothetical protein
MSKSPEICTPTVIANEAPIAEIVAHWIERFGEATPAELLRRTTAARRVGDSEQDSEQAANLIELAVAAQAVLLARLRSDAG